MADNSLIAEGQFDDAVEEVDQLPTVSQATEASNPRAGHTYIDEEGLLEWSSDSSEEDEFDLEEDENEAAAFDGLRAEDEDWEIAERGKINHEIYGIN